MKGCCCKLFLSCLLAVLATKGFSLKLSMANKSKRIYGGTSFDISERPYLVQIRYTGDGERDCGGTLVDSTHVVTAAHCLGDINPFKDLLVVANANTKSDVGIQRNIIKTYVHPKYRIGHFGNNDAAILILDSPIEGKDIWYMDMSFDDVENGKFLSVSGWGWTEKGKLSPNEPARNVRVEKISHDVCKEKYLGIGLTDSMMCATSPDKDACRGDSGGPAIYHNKLLGIVSWGKDCASPDYPGVYTSVRSVKDFLLKYLPMNNTTSK